MAENTRQRKVLTNGPAAAAILASGIGSLALGLFTCLAQALASLNDALSFYDPAGSLSGKTTLAVVVWLAAWVILHHLWKREQVDFGKVFVATLILIALGLLGTFPPFFQVFGGAPPTPPTPTPPPCEAPTLEISVNGDLLQFDNDKLQAVAGTALTLCFKNVSSALQHNWVLVQAGTRDDVVQRGSRHPGSGWVQPDDPDIIAQTKLLGPGQEVQVGFTAPPPGTYRFVCTFPGHDAGGMSGQFVVTP